MKKLIVVIMLILSVDCAIAQQTADLGVQVAAAAYWGDIQKVNYAKSITPVAGILGRWNFNKRIAIRGQILTGNLKADGYFYNALIGQYTYTLDPTTKNKVPVDPYTFLYTPDKSYKYNFNRSFQSVESLFEFNFRDYKLGDMKKNAFTPFVSLGIGVFYSRAHINDKGSFILQNSSAPSIHALKDTIGNQKGKFTNQFDVMTVTIPVGAGLKFNISKRLGGMVELVVRKTFSDNIDNLYDPGRFVKATPTANGNYLPKAPKSQLNNNDYYATLAFSLTYQLWDEKGNCALFDKLRKR